MSRNGSSAFLSAHRPPWRKSGYLQHIAASVWVGTKPALPPRPDSPALWLALVFRAILAGLLFAVPFVLVPLLQG
jgi:hypothetical protein